MNNNIQNIPFINIPFINILYENALKSNMQHRHACIIIFRKKIISVGYNYYKLWNGKIYSDFNKSYESNKYSIHAEQDAIQKIKNKNILKYCKIYIIRITKNNIIEQGIPCENCNNLLNKYKLNFCYCC
jgi:deoxycytidylate deaminase